MPNKYASRTNKYVKLLQVLAPHHYYGYLLPKLSSACGHQTQIGFGNSLVAESLISASGHVTEIITIHLPMSTSR